VLLKRKMRKGRGALSEQILSEQILPPPPPFVRPQPEVTDLGRRLADRPFGRMVLTQAAEVIPLDLFLSSTAGFAARGYVIPEQGSGTPSIGEPLQRVELALDRLTWNWLERRNTMTEQALPIASAHVDGSEFFGEDSSSIKLQLSMMRVDQAQRIYQGSIESTIESGSTSEYAFLLEEIGSPDPVTIVLAVGLVIGLTGLLSMASRSSCSRDARESCRPNGVAWVKTAGSAKTSLDLAGSTTGTHFSDGCEYKCKELPLEDRPVDGTDEPEAEKAPEPINILSDEIEVATEEELQRIIEQEGKELEPEIAAEAEAALGPGVATAVSRALSYPELHPTNFNWRADVARLVNRIQKKFPWQTYANTYRWHPPYDPPLITVRYDAVSVDFWGGGRSNGKYVGYRGKPIGASLGQRVFNAIFNDPYKPNIFWIIWNGRMWVRGTGWEASPWGPPGSDAGHYKHIHVTYR
jgi:hypothetical protein